MKRHFALSLAIFLTLSAAHVDAKKAKPASGAAATKDFIYSAQNPAYDFSYGYPKEAVSITKLHKYLQKEMKKRQAELVKSAREAQADAKANDYEFRPYSEGTAWNISGDHADLLVLSSLQSSYTGGAHGNYDFGSLVWDRKMDKALNNPADIFSNPTTALSSIRNDYCTALNAERKKKNGADWDPRGLGGVFEDCPEYSALAISFEGKDKGPMTQIVFTAAPYVAGSYAEGEYIVSLPITKALFAAVKPQYQNAFAAVK